MSDEADVKAVIRNWHLAISSGDGATLKAAWDQSYDGLIYIAEENNEPLTDWPSISAYYDELLAAPVKWSIDGLQVGVVGDAAWAYLTFVAEGRVEALQHDFVWQGRNSFFLRKNGGDWKIVQYHESLSRDRSHDAWGWFFEAK
jgi:ketosteroid isomerase-like protein